MITIQKASLADIDHIQIMAHSIWHEVYKDMITYNQIEYMLDTIYNHAMLEKQMKEGQQFFLAIENGLYIGYAAVAPTLREDTFKLEKLYVKPDIHKRGIGKKLLQAVEKYTKLHNGKTITLQVNRKNKAVGFYQKMNFIIDKETDVSIGNGYYMNDYIMIKTLIK